MFQILYPYHIPGEKEFNIPGLLRLACEPLTSVRNPNRFWPRSFHEADLVMFNAVVSACAGATQWRRALEVLFRYMRLEAQAVMDLGKL